MLGVLGPMGVLGYDGRVGWQWGEYEVAVGRGMKWRWRGASRRSDVEGHVQAARLTAGYLSAYALLMG